MDLEKPFLHALSLADSLVQYGDGFFETMLAIDNQVHHFDYHWARMTQSANRLGINLPERHGLLNALEQQLSQTEEASAYQVVKLIISRGQGLRGYRSHESQDCHLGVTITPHQLNSKHCQGLNLRICEMKLSAQPALAGMKHCNRLEYVLARREAADKNYDEGLLFDQSGNLIEALVNNVFLCFGNRLLTPDLQYSGVAGTMRAHLLEQCQKNGIEVSVTHISDEKLAQADSVFLTNAVAGVQPVATIQSIEKNYDVKLAQSFQQMVNHPCAEQ